MAMYKVVGLVGLTLCVVGCSGSQATSNPEKPHGDWVALAELQDKAMMEVGMPAGMGDFATARKAATSPAYASAVEAFEKSELPPNLKGQEALKEEIVKNLKSVTDDAKSGNNDKLKADFKAAQDAIAKMKDIQSGKK